MNNATITSTTAGDIFCKYENNEVIDTVLRNKKCTVTLKTLKVHYTTDKQYVVSACKAHKPASYIGYPEMPVHVIKCTRKKLIIKAGFHKFKFPILDQGPVSATYTRINMDDGKLNTLDPLILIRGAREIMFAKARSTQDIEVMMSYNKCIEDTNEIISLLESVRDD